MWRYQWITYLVPLGYTLVAYLIIWGAALGGFYDTSVAAHVRKRLVS